MHGGHPAREHSFRTSGLLTKTRIDGPPAARYLHKAARAHTPGVIPLTEVTRLRDPGNLLLQQSRLRLPNARRPPARLPPQTLLGKGISAPAVVCYTGAPGRTDVDDFVRLRIESGLRSKHWAVAIGCHAVAGAMSAIAGRQDGHIAIGGCHGCQPCTSTLLGPKNCPSS